MLKNFATNYKDLNLDQMSDEEFKLKTHTIKGLSATIGATQLHAIAKELDETQNKQLLPEFYKLLANVISEIDENR